MRQFPRTSFPYGAPMGRATSTPEGPAGLFKDKCRLFQVRLDSGGYDDGGAYWGRDLPLYCCESVDGTLRTFTRHPSREAAKAAILAKFPAVTFYR
jgi:hypothetical protein